ncbi:MAG TPA: hypothetical protein VMT76_01890 [Puia sp.]|nr:hypothetical protein [Puia sp.]
MKKIPDEEERQLMKEAVVPTVSIILPFEPKMSLKTELDYKLKVYVKNIEKELYGNYPAEKVEEVMERLQYIVHHLNYNTHKKSIAIFASPVVGKVFYLDVPVEEKIAIDATFEIRDLIYNKKQIREFLVLVLSAKSSRMYLSGNSKFQLIKSNIPDTSYAYERDMPERVPHFDDPHAVKEIQADKFLLHMDQGLSQILKAYPLPVFIMGAEKIIGHFKKITDNEKNIIGYIHGNYEERTDDELQSLIQPYIADWTDIKQRDILKRIAEAKDESKLASGIKEVFDAASHKNCRLLILEKDFRYPLHKAGVGERSVMTEAVHSFYIHDVVGDVIEKVLDNGGDVELVDKDLLKNEGHIVLIKYY